MKTNASLLDEAGASPFITEFIMVRCGKYRHMAYVDKRGKWRDAYEHEELRGPVQILW